jgi:hypothetical protein
MGTAKGAWCSEKRSSQDCLLVQLLQQMVRAVEELLLVVMPAVRFLFLPLPLLEHLPCLLMPLLLPPLS